jgi:hypothetical protein
MKRQGVEQEDVYTEIYYTKVRSTCNKLMPPGSRAGYKVRATSG